MSFPLRDAEKPDANPTPPQIEYFSLVPSANGDCVKLLSENMLQSSAVAAATAIQGLGTTSNNPDEPQPKVKVFCFCVAPDDAEPASLSPGTEI